MTSKIPSTFSFRPAVTDLPAYVPGAAGQDPSIFKLSSNEVPGPPSPAVIAAIGEAAAGANRYPEMYGDSLCQALADRHGLEAENVLVGNGSVSLLELVLKAALAPGDNVVYSWRSFEAYPILVQVTGAASVQVPNTAEGGHDFAAMAKAISAETKVVIVCTPNNPTSQAATHTQVEDFINTVPDHVLVLLDEAYTHFDLTADKVDGIALLKDNSGNMRKNVIVLRTFSKAYGLAGLRVGYALGAETLISPLRSASTPFGLNSLAAQAALAALNSADYTDQVVSDIVSERDRVVGALREQGWQVGEPQGNFYWLAIGEASYDFAAQAIRHGFTARPFPEGVRVTIAEPEANDRALGLTAEWAKTLLNN